MARTYLSAFVAMTLLTLGLSSCSKNSDNNGQTTQGKASVNMHLTDGPANYDAVYIDIQQVEVTVEGSAAVTLTPLRPGVYNLLEFRNGLDTLLVRADIPAGKISQIRLILGSNSAVVIDGTSYALNTPSAQESGLKLNLNETFAANGSYDLWIDFDAGKSINETGNGKYMLKPVIRGYAKTTDGRVKGYVLPAQAITTVYISNGTDTYSAIPANDGYFMFTGLAAGTYQVTLDASIPPFQDVVLSNVKVEYGITTDLGITTLH